LQARKRYPVGLQARKSPVGLQARKN